MSETAGAGIMNPAGGIRLGTLGRPAPGTEIRLADDGELLVRSPGVMKGYRNDPRRTAEAVDADGWLHTGDVGVCDARGYIRITDRIKDLYITGGFNCYPAEIERILAGHPAIAQSAVVGIPDERQGEVGKAFVVLRPGATLDAPALVAWCREHMANYKVPRQVEFVTVLPTNPSGKVMKFQLRAAKKT